MSFTGSNMVSSNTTFHSLRARLLPVIFKKVIQTHSPILKRTLYRVVFLFCHVPYYSTCHRRMVACKVFIHCTDRAVLAASTLCP